MLETPQMHPLRKYRTDRGIRLKTMAKDAHGCKSTLSRIERGKQNPSFDLMRRLIEASGGALRPEDFMRGAA